MSVIPSPDNYDVGGTIFRFKNQDLGNVVSMQIDPTDLELLQHFTSRSGARKVDRQAVVQKRLKFVVGLDEHAPELWRIYFMGGGTSQQVTPLTDPLSEGEVYVRWLNEDGDIVSFSHTKAVARPSGAMDFGEFNDWVGYQIEVEALFDEGQVGAELGTFTFA